ncbi:carboxymuconolactone decarboxylase family protein [Carnimonas nigrificans]|uniref:carboxymuconolactone decarboxylase family protein n=1 Tax=Carnimonas nigrificans TaxID=64323 RepID=UPI00046E58E6|nr:carboxymuconolactone decarboxylase family protein [Carnimonas nigrificans]
MTASSSSRRESALALLNQLEQGAPEKVADNLDALDRDAIELLLGFAFADVVSRPGLSLPCREMLTVAMLAAMGTTPGQLDFHMRAALNTGVSREEIIEIIYQVAVYAGIPAAINAVASARKAFATT